MAYYEPFTTLTFPRLDLKQLVALVHDRLAQPGAGDVQRLSPFQWHVDVYAPDGRWHVVAVVTVWEGNRVEFQRRRGDAAAFMAWYRRVNGLGDARRPPVPAAGASAAAQQEAVRCLGAMARCRKVDVEAEAWGCLAGVSNVHAPAVGAALYGAMAQRVVDPRTDHEVRRCALTTLCHCVRDDPFTRAAGQRDPRLLDALRGLRGSPVLEVRRQSLEALRHLAPLPSPRCGGEWRAPPHAAASPPPPLC